MSTVAFFEENETAALDRAVEALKSSTTALNRLEPQKLRNMAHDVICAWHRSRADSELKQGAGRARLLDGAVGRVPAMEPYIALALADCTAMDLPWDKPINEWDKEEAVGLISGVLSFAFLHENNSAAPWE